MEAARFIYLLESLASVPSLEALCSFSARFSRQEHSKISLFLLVMHPAFSYHLYKPLATSLPFNLFV